MTTSEQRLDSLLSAISGGVAEIDLNGVITYSSPNNQKMFGYETGELTGMNAFDLMYHPQEREHARIKLADIIARRPKPTPYYITGRRKDGSPLPVRLDWAYLRNDNGELTGLMSVVTDISKQAGLEKGSCEERDLARRYLDVTRFMMVGLDTEGNISVISCQACKVIGYDRRQLLGRNWFETCVPETHRAEALAVFRQLMKGDGEPIEYYESAVIGADGEQHLIAWHNVLHYDTNHQICGVFSSGEDITQKARAKKEKARLYEEIRKAQKIEALGRLTSGIAHDFNNILASILGYADLALDAVTQMGEEEIARYLNEVVMEGEKARDLITQMLAFSRGQASEDIALNPAPLVKELAKVMRSSLPQTIELNVAIEADIPKVEIDPTQLHHALLNVCLNASNALDQRRGTITIGVNRVSCYQTKCSACREIFDGDHVEISVAVDGESIEPYLLDQIVDPVFSKREDNGMGLATVHGMVHEHKGHILVDAIVGYGTTVRLLLPIAPTQPGARADARQPLQESRLGHGACILIVEDDESIAGLQSEVLQSRGFRTEVYSDAYQALARFKTAPERCDCVVVDQAMPSLSGLEFSSQLLALRPELPIILCTTNEKAGAAAGLVHSGIQGRLHKPFSSEQLLDLIFRLLKINSVAPPQR
ncbi:hypothetical protein Tel_01900 [Candidatus Tenderia electrophaga]|jgi:PAS domain S-box-containing protein|uniref:histidine kinase n=1 Tax=Candidatus Tenderia electrophaga TaxID=1748243 RepID=A0A0S2TA28_9GAMM|nr:hypothetical protein Tel_01900 [Candidatus Tenderia electrophaga]